MNFSPRGYTEFKCRGLCLMAMYSKVDLYNIYRNLSNEDKHFQLGDRKYKDYEGAIDRTMNEFSERAIAIEEARFNQELIDEIAGKHEILILILPMMKMTVFQNKTNFLWTRNMQNVTVMRVTMDGFERF